MYTVYNSKKVAVNCVSFRLLTLLTFKLAIMDKVRILDYPVERPLTLRERIVDFIKDSIISGRLKPGERVPEQEIAESFGISRTPIREAFRQLEGEGFISVVARKGAGASPSPDNAVRDFYVIKSLLEGYAARIACQTLAPKDLK